MTAKPRTTASSSRASNKVKVQIASGPKGLRGGGRGGPPGPLRYPENRPARKSPHSPITRRAVREPERVWAHGVLQTYSNGPIQLRIGHLNVQASTYVPPNMIWFPDTFDTCKVRPHGQHQR
jgi:hypothetical protein